LPPVGTGGYSHTSLAEKVLMYGWSFGAYNVNKVVVWGMAWCVLESSPLRGSREVRNIYA